VAWAPSFSHGGCNQLSRPGEARALFPHTSLLTHKSDDIIRRESGSLLLTSHVLTPRRISMLLDSSVMILYYDLFRVLGLYSTRFGCFKESSKSVTVVRNTPFFGIAGTYGIATVNSMLWKCDKRFHQPRILKSSDQRRRAPFTSLH
jgi:hypothetical protein